MLQRARIWFLLASVLFFCVAREDLFPQAPSGNHKVAEFQLKDTTGRLHTLRSYADRILVLVFWSYKCPAVLAENERFMALKEKYESRGITILGVDSNSNETALEISRNAANLKITFPILVDSDGLLANSVGATHTPSIFVIDQSGEVRYQGAFDNNKKEGSKGREPYVDNAIDELLAGKPVLVHATKAFGCIIP